MSICKFLKEQIKQNSMYNEKYLIKCINQINQIIQIKQINQQTSQTNTIPIQQTNNINLKYQTNIFHLNLIKRSKIKVKVKVKKMNNKITSLTKANKKQQQLQLSNDSITYRNAIYEGNIQQQSRNDFGIIYMAKSHQFICCNNWNNDKLQGQCLFYNSDKKYIYGIWINNVPQGFNVFRIQETLVFADFYKGKLSKGSKVLVLFQKYNLAAILIVINQFDNLEDIQFDVFSKKQVFTSEDLFNLFKQCLWPQQYFKNNQTLIKYISTKLTPINHKHSELARKTRKNPVKLRLIQNKFYRFGYDQGLAIVFDQDFDRISIGYHLKSKLKSFGIIFNRTRKQKIIQEGIFKIGQHNLLFNHQNDLNKGQNAKLSKIYKTNLLMGVNFSNKFYKNPSKFYQFTIQSIINRNFVRNLVSGSLTTRRLLDQQSLNFSRIDTNRENNASSQAIIKPQQYLKVQSLLTENRQQNAQKKQNQETDKILVDRLRLQAIKKQIYESLERKQFAAEKKLKNQKSQRAFINKEIVGKRDNWSVEDYNTPQKNTEKSRSRKKIFQESQKNLKILRDFTPSKSQSNLTPFKTKMKHRIFTNQVSRTHEGRKYIRQEQNENFSRNASNRNIFNKLQERDYAPDFSKYSSQNQSQPINRNNGNRNYRQIYDQQKGNKPRSLYGQKYQQNLAQSQSNQHQSNRVTFQINNNHNYVPINTNEQKSKKKQSRVSAIKKDIQSKKSSGITYNYLNPSEERGIHHHDSRQSSRKSQDAQNQFTLFPRQNNKNQSKSSRQIVQKVYEDSFQDKNSRFNQKKNRAHALNEQNFEEQYIRLKKQQNSLLKNPNPAQSQIHVQFQNQNQNNVRKISPYNKSINTSNKNKKTPFKNSNQIYLEAKTMNIQPQKQHDIDKSNRKKYNYLNGTQKNEQSFNQKNIPISFKHQRERSPSGSSYVKKYQVKRSIEKQIERSPDKHRCYGKNANQPYLQGSPSFTKQFSHQNSFTKNSFQYESSHAKHNKDIIYVREPRNKLF